MTHIETVGTFDAGPTRRMLRRGTLQGDFAAGQETTPRLGRVAVRADFASGQRREPADPTQFGGDFAAGQRRAAPNSTPTPGADRVDAEAAGRRHPDRGPTLC